jgi:hypothetical protein
MAYNATYGTGDLSPIVSDGLGTAGASIVGFMAVIVLIALVVWGYNKVRKVR